MPDSPFARRLATSRSRTRRQSPAPAAAAWASPRTSCGKSFTSTTWPGAITVTQWQTFSSWRTLPGHSCAARNCIAASVRRLPSTPRSRALFARKCRARAVPVQRARHQLLARARIARDEDGRLRLREAPDGAEDFLHRRRLAENLRRLLGLRGSLDLAQAFVERAAHQLDRVVNVEGLGQVLEGAALERGHRALEVGICRHDDHGRGGQARAQLAHELEAGHARHADIAHHDLRGFLGELLERFARGAEGAVGDALAGERLLEDPADRAVVVDDPDGIHGVFAGVHSILAPSARTRTGSRIVKRVRPGTLSNSISPRCWLTKLCASDSPRPVPPSRPLTSG